MNQLRKKAYILFFSLFFLIFINSCYGLSNIYQTYKENRNLQLESAEIAKRIIDPFAKPIRIGTETFKISVSIGIAIYPENGRDYLTLLKNADEALYEAKKERNTFKFSDWVLD